MNVYILDDGAPQKLMWVGKQVSGKSSSPVALAPDTVIEAGDLVLLNLPKPWDADSAVGLLESPGVRLALENPQAHFLFSSYWGADDLADTVANWLDGTGALITDQKERVKQLMLAGPLRFSFVNTDQTQADLTVFLKHVQEVRKWAKFDPTGFRTLCHAIIRTSLTSADRKQRAFRLPEYAVSADDDFSTAVRHAYLLRRLGECPIPVTTRDAFEFILGDKKCWLGKTTPKTFLLDSHLAFDRFAETGEDVASQWSPAPARSVIATGRQSRLNLDDSGSESAKYKVVEKPIVDLRDLQVRLDASDEQEADQYKVELLHTRLLNQVRHLSSKLIERASKTEEPTLRLPLYHEAYMLARGFDGSIAAHAYRELLKSELDYAADLYASRQSAIEDISDLLALEVETSITNAFPNGFELEADSWKIRCARTVLKSIRDNDLPESMHESLTRYMRDSERCLRRHIDISKSYLKRPFLFLRRQVVKTWFSLDRIPALLRTWVLIFFVFSATYMWIGSTLGKLDPVRLEDWISCCTASMAGALSSGVDTAYGVDFGNGSQYWLGFAQSFLSLILLTRLIDLVVQRWDS